MVLRVSPQEAPYVLSLPLHASQQVVAEQHGYLKVELHVILNYELEREILGFGEEVEVVEPVHLREKIAERLERGRGFYESA
ncbi:hypothetical protein BH24BAC1_BH24BAC1_20750 [soil metagenome]